MTKRILTSLATISFVLLALASPNSAQERPAGSRPLIGVRSQENRQVVDVAAAEKLRADLIAAYDESEALLKYLAGYDFIRQSGAMKDYEEICQNLSNGRALIEQMSTEDLAAQARSWPYARNIGRTVKISRDIRSDVNFQAVLQKAARYSQAGLGSRNASSARGVDARGVIAAPAYIAPNCNFDDPSTYPSGVDLGIAAGVAIALHVAVEAQPAEFMIFCAIIPNPFRIAFAIAAGIADQVLNALTAVAKDAGYCESIRLYVEEEMSNGLNAILMNDNYYLTFTYNSIKAALSKATGTGVPTNCGNAKFTQAQAYFDGSGNFTGTGPERVVAYKLLRTAYQNIGASACVQ